MSSDLIAWTVAITLGVAVVGLGLQRNLGDVTRDWLPRFGDTPKSAAIPGLIDFGRERRQLSPRQRLLAIWTYLLLSFYNATVAVLWTDDRVWHSISAVLFAIGVVVFVKRSPTRPASPG